MRARVQPEADNEGMNIVPGPDDSLLGRETAYPDRYAPGLLFAIPRARGRAALGIAETPPFIGHDRWHAYELGWLDARGKPQAATATLHVPADSPNLIESKSLKLYLNSLNGECMADAAALQARIETDLSKVAGAPVTMVFGLPPVASVPDAAMIDGLDIEVAEDAYAEPNPTHLRADTGELREETLASGLLKSNCPVTGQPDWATLVIDYQGPRIDPAGLLRYLIGFREHREFHEQCVERIFVDLQARCRPAWLSVEARYTRRGGLDINPWRATPGRPAPTPVRDPRQ